MFPERVMNEVSADTGAVNPSAVAKARTKENVLMGLFITAVAKNPPMFSKY